MATGVCCAAWSAVPSASAITIRDDIGGSGSRAFADSDDAFDAVVWVDGCTGVLIAPDVILTARHCGIFNGDQVRFGTNVNSPDLIRTVTSVSNPDGFGSLLDGGDVTIARLSSPVPSSVATPLRIIDETVGLVGQVAATLGYGFNGVGSSGHGFTGDDRRWGGTNVIDRYGTAPGSSSSFTSNIFSTDFDNGSFFNNTISGSDPTPTEFEATTAPGDSGGPLLVNIGDEWLVAGVLSGGTTFNSVYGDISWWTGVQPYRTQIEAFGGQFTLIPEPSGALALASAGLILARRRR
ncbi:MAG: trypsin-like serine protease [Planctomycetota bacterium]